MDTINRKLIEHALIYIEKNLKNTLLLENVSDYLCISKFHMHRIFKSLTGLPLMTYIRRRRLSNSLIDLRLSNLKIIDIAYEYQFEYVQSYERSFKQLFGMTPSHYRLYHCEVQIYPPYDINLLQNTTNGIIAPPFFVTRPMFFLGGIKCLINHQENYDHGTANSNALDFFYKKRSQLIHTVDDSVYYGLVTCYGSTEADYYMPSLEIIRPFKDHDIFTCHTVPASEYAVFRYIGLHAPEDLNMQKLDDIYSMIEKTWTPATSYQVDSSYHFEMICRKRCSENYCEADLYYPLLLKKKKIF